MKPARSRRCCRLASGLALLVALAACERDHVEVTIEPRADGSFVRTIRLWHSDTEKKGQILPPPAALAEQAKAQYPKRVVAKDAAVVFQGDFRVVPPDLRRGNETNRGEYTVWPSRLGHIAYYRERRPGRTDHFTRFREAADSVDVLVKLISAIASQQLKGEKGLELLVEFIEGPFRRDLKEAIFFVAHADLGALSLVHGQDPEATLVSAAAFLLQFAEERGYLEAADVPRLRTRDGALGVVASLIARKMGRPLDAALRQRLAALAAPEAAAAAYQAALQELKLTEKQFDDAIKPLVQDLLHLKLFAVSCELRYVLVLPAQAELRFTNGQHDAKANTIRWTDELDDRPVASVYFALWSAPDEEWQKAHLGQIALRGRDLVDYVLWETSLPAEQAAAWRAALERLNPKGDLAQQLAAIRLVPDAKEPEPEEGARRLIEALKPKTP